jgi:hypothetical protein
MPTTKQYDKSTPPDEIAKGFASTACHLEFFITGASSCAGKDCFS